MKRENVAETIVREALCDVLLEKMLNGELNEFPGQRKDSPTIYTVSKRTKKHDDRPITAQPIGYHSDIGLGAGCYRKLPTCRD